MAEQFEHRKEDSSTKGHLNPALSTRSSKHGGGGRSCLEGHSRGAGTSSGHGGSYRTRSRSGTRRDFKRAVNERVERSQEPVPSTSTDTRQHRSKKRTREPSSSTVSHEASDSASGHRYPLRSRERSNSGARPDTSSSPPPKKIVPQKRAHFKRSAATSTKSQPETSKGRLRLRGSGCGGLRHSSTTGSCASTSGRRSGRSPKAPLSSGMSSESGGGGGASSVPTEQGAQSPPLLGSGSSSLTGGPSTGEGESGGTTGEEGEVGRLQALLEARGLPPHLFGALAPRMQHLLHRGTLPSSTSTKAAQLVSGLQAVGDESAQLQAVIEMCQLLVMGNEDTLAGFPVKQAVPALLTLLNMEHNFDMMNQACRALTYMMEVLPRSCGVIVEAVPVFLEKLQVIQCMDVAEQSLTALEMLSRRHSKPILQARGVSACLMYLDFFSINAQRAALAVTANCCQNLSSNEFPLVQESLPLLSQRLQQQDKKSVESVCLAISRLVDSCQHDPAKLQEIASNGLTSNIQQLLVVSPPVISSGTFIMVVRMLSTLCASCPQLAVQLLKQNIADTLCYLLVGTSDASSNQVELVSRSPQELYELVFLIAELMPRLPSDGMFSVDWWLSKPVTATQQDLAHWQWRDERGLWHSYTSADSRHIETAHQAGEDEASLSTVGRTYTIDFHVMQQINEATCTTRPVQRKLNSGSCNNNSCNTDDRAECLQHEAELASSFIRSVFTVVHEVYSSSAGPAVRHKCLHALLRSVFFASPQLLKDVLKCVQVSCQLAAMLSSSDQKIVVGALQLAEILMQKLPEEFAVHFHREGVMHQIHRLCCVDSPAASPIPQPLSSSMPSLAPLCAPHTSRETLLFGVTNSFMLPQPAPPSPALDTDDRSPSPPHVRRISDVLKRKRTPKRGSAVSRKVRTEDISPSPSPDPFIRMGASYGGSRESRSGSASASNRSKFSGTSSKTTGFLANLNPARWGKNSAANPLHDRAYAKEAGMYKSSTHPSVSGQREKVKQWICEQASAFHNRYFSTEGGSQNPALSTLNRLTGAINALNDKPGEDMEALCAIRSIVSESDISPFEVIHSGLVNALLRYLTSNSDRHQRLRTFLHVFLNCPSEFSGMISKLEEGASVPLSALMSKLHGCVNQLEQFPVKVHDLPTGSTGARNGTSALKFFNSHQLKCNLVRHPSCRSLRQWKGGPVKIDPLALVQAIERYLVMRGYARQRDDDLDAESEDDNSDEDVDDTLAAVIISQTGSRHRLQFMIGDHVLPYNMTVYQAVRQFSASGSTSALDQSETDTDSETSLSHHNIWAMTHTIIYRPVPEEDGGSSSKSQTTTTSRKGKGGNKHSSKKKDDLWTEGIVPSTVCPLEPYLLPRLPDSVSVQDRSLPVLALLRILHALNRYWGALYHPQSYQPRLSHTEFINSKLTAKANRQLQDPLVIMTGNLPNWLSQLAHACPFVFPFETRQMLLYATAWDRDRAVQRLVETTPELSQPGESTERVTPRLERRKRTVTRTDLLKQAEAVLQELGASRALLEIQYENEVGTGLGPTLEFYTLVSRELQRADLDLWRGGTVKVSGRKGSTESPTEYVHSPHGLFPIPLPRNAKPAHVARLKSRFKFLGRLMAKALMDSRMLDLPMNPLVYRWLLGGERSLGCADMQWVDPTLARSFFQMLELAGRKARLCESGGSSIQEALSQLLLDGCPVDDLGLDFTLPGYPNIELRKGGKDITVTIQNLDDYLKLVAHWTLREGVSRQMEALKEGFESVFPLSHLAMFYPEELDALFCGGHGGWDVKTLMECCRPDHGFTHDSRAVRYLFEILSSYDKEQQRQFLQFVTGSPRLPVGGFKSLSPPLTIVRKTFSGNENPDEFLPSVMTCVNYLKLPDYSSMDLMREKLRIAEQEGQHCFHLS